MNIFRKNKILVLGLLFTCIGLYAGKNDFGSEGTFKIGELNCEWKDEKRDREVPAKIYFPSDNPGKCPVIVFSHGLGGSRDGYAYLGKHWASHGYVCVHVQHKGSDSGIFKSDAPEKALQKSVSDIRNSLNRPKDISFAIDMLVKMNSSETPLKNRLDLDKIGAGGHSYGAYTVLAVAGQGPGRGNFLSLKDERVKAVIPMSAPASSAKANLDKVYADIKIPCLHMTGTKDNSPIGQTSPEERRIPYDHIKCPEQYLITFKDGDHMVFSGRRRGAPGKNDPLYHELILTASTAFWDAYLKGYKKALDFLKQNDGLRKTLGQSATLEIK